MATAHIDSSPASAWTRLVRYASEPRFLIGASVFRLIAGLTFVYQLLSVYGQRHYLFGPDGVYPYDDLLQAVDGASFSIYAWSRSPLFFEVAYHASIAIAMLWLLGWRTRIVTPLLYVAVWSLRNRNPMLWDGGDNLMQLALFYVAFADLSARFSLDAARRARSAARPMGPVLAMMHNAGVLACAIQISLVYGVAGLTKVQGETWQNGTALYYALRGGEFTWPGYSEWIFQNATVLALLAYATVAFQISFPFLLFLGRRLRLLLLVGGLSFHLGIMSFMALVSFGAFMMAVDLIFVTDDEYRAIGRAVARVGAVFRRFSGPAPQQPGLVLFDGDCGLCQRVAERLASRHGEAVAVWRPWQGEVALPAGVTVERLEREVVLVRADGAVLGGHRAFAALLARTPGWRLVGVALSIPGLGAVAGWGYRAVAARRRWVSRRLGLTACALPRSPAPHRARRIP